jgi:acyl-CoA thioesterase
MISATAPLPGAANTNPSVASVPNLKGSFIRHVGLVFDQREPGFTRIHLPIEPHHTNSTQVVHGGVTYTLVDTAMGAALYLTLAPDEICATIEIKINYFKPVFGGTLVCEGQLVHKGKSVANLDASVWVDEVLVAKANGSFAILKRKL